MFLASRIVIPLFLLTHSLNLAFSYSFEESSSQNEIEQRNDLADLATQGSALDRYKTLQEILWSNGMDGSAAGEDFIKTLANEAAKRGEIDSLTELLHSPYWKYAVSGFQSLSSEEQEYFVSLNSQTDLNKIKAMLAKVKSSPARLIALLNLLERFSGEAILKLVIEHLKFTGPAGFPLFRKMNAKSLSASLLKLLLSEAVEKYGIRALEFIRAHYFHPNKAIQRFTMLLLLKLASTTGIPITESDKEAIKKFIDNNFVEITLVRRLEKLLEEQRIPDLPHETAVDLPDPKAHSAARVFFHYQPVFLKNNYTCQSLKTKATCDTVPDCVWMSAAEKNKEVDKIFADTGGNYPRHLLKKDTCESIFFRNVLSNINITKTAYVKGISPKSMTVQPMLRDRYISNHSSVVKFFKRSPMPSLLIYEADMHGGYLMRNKFFASILESLNPKSGTRIVLIDDTCSFATKVRVKGDNKTFFYSNMYEKALHLMHAMARWDKKTTNIEVTLLGNVTCAGFLYQPDYRVVISKNKGVIRIKRRGPRPCYSNEPNNYFSKNSCVPRRQSDSHRCTNEKRQIVAETCVCDPNRDKCEWQEMPELFITPFWLFLDIGGKSAKDIKVTGKLITEDSRRAKQSKIDCDGINKGPICSTKGITTRSEVFLLTPKLKRGQDPANFKSKWVAGNGRGTYSWMEPRFRCNCFTKDWRGGISECRVYYGVNYCKLEIEPKNQPKSVSFSFSQDEHTSKEKLVLKISKNNKEKKVCRNNKSDDCSFVSNDYKDSFTVTLVPFPTITNFHLQWSAKNGSTCGIANEGMGLEPQQRTWILSGKKRFAEEKCVLSLVPATDGSEGQANHEPSVPVIFETQTTGTDID